MGQHFRFLHLSVYVEDLTRMLANFMLSPDPHHADQPDHISFFYMLECTLIQIGQHLTRAVPHNTKYPFAIVFKNGYNLDIHSSHFDLFLHEQLLANLSGQGTSDIHKRVKHILSHNFVETSSLKVAFDVDPVVFEYPKRFIIFYF